MKLMRSTELFTIRMNRTDVIRYKNLPESEKRFVRQYMKKQFENVLNHQLNLDEMIDDMNTVESTMRDRRREHLQKLREWEEIFHEKMMDNLRLTSSEFIPAYRKSQYVYVVATPSQMKKGVYKIGVSQDVESRIKQLNTSTPEHFEKVVVFKCDDAFGVESELHEILEENRLEGEFFKLSPVDWTIIGNCVAEHEGMIEYERGGYD